MLHPVSAAKSTGDGFGSLHEINEVGAPSEDCALRAMASTRSSPESGSQMNICRCDCSLRPCPASRFQSKITDSQSVHRSI